MSEQLKKMYFDVDASQIDIKPLLEKEFLELSMKAISTANPNRNGSWFTKESLENSKHTFTNKPILGYFENEDFVSHNGEWEHDPETNMDYWNTLGKQGERVLGMIRESDEIDIVEDKNGLFWICFTCALWTQYSYRQVKRLLKDAQKAKKTGKSAKNISVEIDVTDYEILENGIMKINSFNLVGVTILGSRNGMKVEPGIEDAELSVVDVMGRDLYEQQTRSLRLAYEKLEDKKEVSSKVALENEIQEQNIEAQEQESQEQEVQETQTTTEMSFEDKNEVSEEQTVDNVEQKEENSVEHNEQFEDTCSQCEEKEENCECEADTEQKCESEEQKQEEAKCENEEKNEEAETEPKTDCLEKQTCEDGCGCDDEDHKDDDDEESEHETEEAKEEKQESCNYEAIIQQMSEKVCELENEVKILSEEKTKLMEKVASYEKEDFVKSAKEIINKTNLSDEKKQNYVSKCQSGEIDSIDSLKTKIALELFEEIMNKDSESQEKEEKQSFSMNIEIPNVTYFAEKKENKKENKDCWDSIKTYNTEK